MVFMDIPYEVVKYVALLAVLGAAITVVFFLFPDILNNLGSVSGLWGRALARS
jgi:hypothetical protein